MCGIVGLISYDPKGLSSWNYKVFMNMLYADAARGMHGTGMFAVDSGGSMTRVKVGGPPNQLFATKEYEGVEKFIGARDIRFLVGHNRYATKGKRITEHSHPFRDGHIVLVHNGTLEDYKHLPDYDKYEVDSELLTHAIAVDGVEKTIQSLEGAWTIVYWDSKAKCLNILRNDERPLFLAYHEGEKMFAFASEQEMLEWCLKRNGYYQYTVNEVPADTFISFPLAKNEPIEKELKGKPKKKKSKYEVYDLAFDNAADACNTACGVLRDAEIVPIQGEWSRGKTGSVLLQDKSGGKHKGNNIYKKSREVAEGKRWVAVEHLHELSKGQWVTAQIIDYDVMDGTTDMFRFLCLINEFPDVEFVCNVRGEKAAEAIADATVGVRAQIFQIMKSTQPPALCPHRVYLHNPEPAYQSDPVLPQVH